MCLCVRFREKIPLCASLRALCGSARVKLISVCNTTFSLGEKILPLGKTQIFLVFRSLIRTFAQQNEENSILYGLAGLADDLVFRNEIRC